MGLFELMNNPMMGLAAGLLSARGPGGTFGSGMGQGLQNMMAMQGNNQQMRIAEARMEELEAKKRLRESLARAGQNYQQDPQGLMSALMGSGDPQYMQLGLSLANPKDTRPNKIQEYDYLLQNPEYMALAQQMAQAGANRTQVNVGLDKPLSVGDLGKLRNDAGEMPPLGSTARSAAADGFTVRDIRATEQAGKEAMLQGAIDAVPLIETLLFDENGNVNHWVKGVARTPFAALNDEARDLATAFETGIQAITRQETGAAMPPGEVENTRKRFQPGVFDDDITAKIKLDMYKDALNGSLSLMRTGEYGIPSLDVMKFQAEIAKRRREKMKGGGVLPDSEQRELEELRRLQGGGQ